MVRLRPATLQDTRFIWECRNDPDARQASLSTGDIPYREHRPWFFQHRYEYVVAETSDALAVGYGRLFDGEISVAVHPLLRRMGFGSQIISALSAYSTEPLTAWIRPENIASQKAFAFAGYHQVEQITSSGVELQRWEYRP